MTLPKREIKATVTQILDAVMLITESKCARAVEILMGILRPLTNEEINDYAEGHLGFDGFTIERVKEIKRHLITLRKTCESNRRNKVCQKCKHLIFPDEAHVCPTAEEQAQVQALVSGAAEAVEYYNEDGLEAYAERLRNQRKEIGEYEKWYWWVADYANQPDFDKKDLTGYLSDRVLQILIEVGKTIPVQKREAGRFFDYVQRVCGDGAGETVWNWQEEKRRQAKREDKRN